MSSSICTNAGMLEEPPVRRTRPMFSGAIPASSTAREDLGSDGPHRLRDQVLELVAPHRNRHIDAGAVEFDGRVRCCRQFDLGLFDGAVELVCVTAVEDGLRPLQAARRLGRCGTR